METAQLVDFDELLYEKIEYFSLKNSFLLGLCIKRLKKKNSLKIA